MSRTYIKAVSYDRVRTKDLERKPGFRDRRDGVSVRGELIHIAFCDTEDRVGMEQAYKEVLDAVTDWGRAQHVQISSYTPMPGIIEERDIVGHNIGDRG